MTTPEITEQHRAGFEQALADVCSLVEANIVSGDVDDDTAVFNTAGLIGDFASRLAASVSMEEKLRAVEQERDEWRDRAARIQARLDKANGDLNSYQKTMEAIAQSPETARVQELEAEVGRLRTEFMGVVDFAADMAGAEADTFMRVWREGGCEACNDKHNEWADFREWRDKRRARTALGEQNHG